MPRDNSLTTSTPHQQVHQNPSSLLEQRRALQIHGREFQRRQRQQVDAEECGAAVDHHPQVVPAQLCSAELPPVLREAAAHCVRACHTICRTLQSGSVELQWTCVYVLKYVRTYAPSRSAVSPATMA